MTSDELDELIEKAVAAFTKIEGVDTDLAEKLVEEGILGYDDLSVMEIADLVNTIEGLSEEQAIGIVARAEVLAEGQSSGAVGGTTRTVPTVPAFESIIDGGPAYRQTVGNPPGEVKRTTGTGADTSTIVTDSAPVPDDPGDAPREAGKPDHSSGVGATVAVAEEAGVTAAETDPTIKATTGLDGSTSAAGEPSGVGPARSATWRDSPGESAPTREASIPMITPRHGFLCANVARVLGELVREHELGRVLIYDPQAAPDDDPDPGPDCLLLQLREDAGGGASPTAPLRPPPIWSSRSIGRARVGARSGGGSSDTRTWECTWSACLGAVQEQLPTLPLDRLRKLGKTPRKLDVVLG